MCIFFLCVKLAESVSSHLMSNPPEEDGGTAHGKEAAAGTAGTAGVTPSPAIVKKVKKVVEMRLDAPELAVALQQLCEFYGPNTLENRRNLRATIERRGVDVNKQFAGCFADVMGKLERVEGHVERLAECSQRMRQRLQTAQATTSQVLKMTEQLQTKESTVEAHKEVTEAFLTRFRLQPDEMAVLTSGDISEEFLSVLARVAEIQVASKKLLRVHHKTALMDIVDEAGSLQEQAYNRLYRWLQDRFARVHGDSSDTPPLMKTALKTLRARTELYKVCLEDLAVSRRQALSQRFLVALTRGGTNGHPKPIEIHAHDPQRYVADMLAWVHQALASERELLVALFSDTSGAAGEGGEGGMQGEQERVLAGIMEAVCPTLQARVESVLHNHAVAVTVFKLGNLLLFYLHTIGGLLREDAALTTTLQTCHKLAGKVYMDLLTVNAQRLYKQPPPCPPSLAPHAEVVLQLEELLQVMQSFETSLIPARLRENYFKPVIEEGVEPVIGSCSLSANAIPTAEGSVYLVNCLLAVQVVLQKFDFCGWRLEKLHTQLAHALEQAVREQIIAIMRTCNLDDKMYTLRSWKNALQAADSGGAGEELAQMAGMDAMSVSLALKHFYGVVLTSSIDFKFVDRISNSSIRAQARSQVAIPADMTGRVVQIDSHRESPWRMKP